LDVKDNSKLDEETIRGELAGAKSPIDEASVLLVEVIKRLHADVGAALTDEAIAAAAILEEFDLAAFARYKRNLRGLSDLETPKGYNRANLVDAFERYLAPSNRHNATTQRGVGGNDDFQNATAGRCGGSGKWVNPLGESGCGGVADRDWMSGRLGHMSEGEDEGEL
jgi:hypothetical protein